MKALLKQVKEKSNKYFHKLLSLFSSLEKQTSNFDFPVVHIEFPYCELDELGYSCLHNHIELLNMSGFRVTIKIANKCKSNEFLGWESLYHEGILISQRSLQIQVKHGEKKILVSQTLYLDTPLESVHPCYSLIYEPYCYPVYQEGICIHP